MKSDDFLALMALIISCLVFFFVCVVAVRLSRIEDIVTQYMVCINSGYEIIDSFLSNL